MCAIEQMAGLASWRELRGDSGRLSYGQAPNPRVRNFPISRQSGWSRRRSAKSQSTVAFAAAIVGP